MFCFITNAEVLTRSLQNVVKHVVSTDLRVSSLWVKTLISSVCNFADPSFPEKLELIQVHLLQNFA